MAGERHGRGMGMACHVWINLKYNQLKGDEVAVTVGLNVYGNFDFQKLNELNV